MKIWQTIDKDGTEKTHLTEKPFLYSDMARNKFFGCKETDTALPTFLFPIDLKPLQIAEITVNENGTWSWEIEREEGWYIVRHLEGNRDSYSGQGVVTYSKGKFSWLNDGEVDADDLKHLAISHTRIPDECII